MFLCEDPIASAQNLGFLAHQVWSTEEGLPQASVHQIFQSRDGYLWLATEGGVARFDGVAWKSYTHETTPAFTSDDVSAIAEAPAGVLWFGTSDGLVRMAAGSFRRFTIEDGLPSSSILSVVNLDQDGLLVLTAAGLAQVDHTGVHSLPGPTQSLTSMERTADGTIWLFGGGKSFRYDGRAAVPIALPDSSAGSKDSVGTGPAGTVWFGTAHGLSCITGGDRRTITLPKELAGARIQTLLVDRSGTAWVGTNRGLFTVTAQPSARTEKVEALGTESVLSMLQDREGNYWIGGENSGVHVLRARKFRAEKSVLGESLTAVVQASDGLLWFGKRDDGLGLLQLDGVEARPNPAAALTSPVILSLAPGLHGDVWAGTPDGLNHMDHGRVQTYTAADGLPDDFVRSLLVSRDGSVWIGTRHGLAHLEHEKLTTLTRADGLASDSIGPLLETSTGHAMSSLSGSPSRSPDLWIGTAAGLTHLGGNRVQNFAPPRGLGGTIVTALAGGANGELWVAVHGASLSRFTDGVFQPIGLRALPQEISALIVDPDGYLWMRGKRGLYRVATGAINACALAKGPCSAGVDDFGVPDGLPSDEPATEGSPSLWQAAGGALWVATRKGLASADASHLPVNSVPPPVVLQRFVVDDAEQPLTLDNLRIGSGHRSFSFDYAALSYTMPSRIRYRYKLEGLDRDWTDAGTRRTAYYTSLPGRHYRFRVIAANNDGVWNETGADLRFSVLPPLYLRWWFYVLLLLLLFALIALAFQLRLRRVRGQFALVLKERNRVAREIHDTLAQDFVSVSLQLELVSQLVRGNKLTQAAEQIGETRSLVKKGLEAARQSIWDLRANVEQNALPLQLRKAVDDFAQRHPEAHIKVGGAYRQLDEPTEREVLRIAQESLSNVDRHAAATAVHVELRYDPDQLALTVRDDGAGFFTGPALAKEGHYGLRGMQERAHALGGRLTIASNPGEGTTVTLTVPLRNGEGS